MVVGGDPLAFFCGGIEMPYGTFELDVVGGMRGRPVKMVRGQVTGLPFPAAAEVVLEGYVTPDKRVIEGPFGEWTGYYSGRRRPCLDLEITRLYHRDDPILLGAPPSKPPHDYSYMRTVMKSAMIHDELVSMGVPDVLSA